MDAGRLTDETPDLAAPAIPPSFNGDGRCLGECETSAYGPPWDAMNGMGITKGGTDIRHAPQMWIVAVDPAVIPLGTRLFVPGYGAAVAADVGTAVKGNIIDLWMPTTAQALAWGRRTVTITVYG